MLLFFAPSTEVVVDKGGAGVTSRFPCRVGERDVVQGDEMGCCGAVAVQSKRKTGFTRDQSHLDKCLGRICLTSGIRFLLTSIGGACRSVPDECLDWLGMGPLLFCFTHLLMYLLLHTTH